LFCFEGKFVFESSCCFFSACAIQIIPGDFLIITIEYIELIILIDFGDLSGQRKPFTVSYFLIPSFPRV